jgi:hypothetical protein
MTRALAIMNVCFGMRARCQANDEARMSNDEKMTNDESARDYMNVGLEWERDGKRMTKHECRMTKK